MSKEESPAGRYEELRNQVLVHEDDDTSLRLLALKVYEIERGHPYIDDGTLRLAATWNWSNPMLCVPVATRRHARIYRLVAIDKERGIGRCVGSARLEQVLAAPKLPLSPGGALYHVLGEREMNESFPSEMCVWCGQRRFAEYHGSGSGDLH